MDVQFLHHVANTQDGIYLQVKKQKQTPITPHLKASVFVAEHTLAKQHKKMLMLISTQSQLSTSGNTPTTSSCGKF